MNRALTLLAGQLPEGPQFPAEALEDHYGAKINGEYLEFSEAAMGRMEPWFLARLEEFVRAHKIVVEYRPYDMMYQLRAPRSGEDWRAPYPLFRA